MEYKQVEEEPPSLLLLDVSCDECVNDAVHRCRDCLAPLCIDHLETHKHKFGEDFLRFLKKCCCCSKNDSH